MPKPIGGSMKTVKELMAVTGYSKGQILRACHLVGIDKIGYQFVFVNQKQIDAVIEDIKKRRQGNPLFFDSEFQKNKKSKKKLNNA